MDTRQFSRYYVYIKPLVRNKHVRTYSSLVFTIITITIFAIFAIRPTLSTIVSLQKSIEEQKALLAQINSKIQAMSEARINYQNIEPEVKQKLMGIVPDSANFPSLIDNLSAVALNQQASISGLQFQPVNLQTPPKSPSKTFQSTAIDFTFNTQGSYNQLVNTLTTLSKTNRLIEIYSVSFNKPEDGPLIMSVNGKSYYYKY